MIRRLLQHDLPIACAISAAFGLLMGLYLGWPFLSQGFGWLTLSGIQRTLHWALVVGGALTIGHGLLHGLLFWLRHRGARVRRNSESAGSEGRSPLWLTALAASLAALPWIAWGGYLWNQSHGIKPSFLFESYSLRLNGLYLLACAALLALSIALFHHWQGNRQTPSLKSALRWLVPLAVLVVGLQLVLSQAFAQGATEKRRPDVLVLLVDALRADHLSSYGSDRPTPSIDALAADGLLFRHAISQSTFTKTSIASLFTGRPAYQHGVYWGSHKENPESITSDLLSLEETTLAETLSKQGYLTNAWVQNGHLRDFMGFGQGFVDYNDQQGSIERIHRQAWPFLSGAAQRYNFFTYLHYIDLHDPYLPEAPYDRLFGQHEGVYDDIDLANWGTYLAAVRRGEETPSTALVQQFEDYYDGLIRKVDDHIGHLIAELKRKGLYDSTLIVLTSDHGDAFMEHGFISHSTTPYEELARIPLIVKLPSQEHAGQIFEPQVRLVDVMPTVLRAVGLDVPRPVSGCDLSPLWDAEQPPRPAHCLLAVSEIAEDGAYPTVAVRSQRFKYVHFESQPDELYDLQTDPLEQQSLQIESLTEGSPQRREADLLQQQALQIHTLRQRDAQKIELDEQQIRELKALGYLD